MKNILVLSLFIYSSCALYRDFKTPAPATVKPQPVKTVEPVKTLDNSKSYRSADGRATLIVSPDLVQVALRNNTMSYREGHSVELKFDQGAPVIKRVLPTDNHIVQFAESEEVMKLLQGKKSLQVELHLDDVGLNIFSFNL